MSKGDDIAEKPFRPGTCLDPAAGPRAPRGAAAVVPRETGGQSRASRDPGSETVTARRRSAICAERGFTDTVISGGGVKMPSTRGTAPCVASGVPSHRSHSPLPLFFFFDKRFCGRTQTVRRLRPSPSCLRSAGGSGRTPYGVGGTPYGVRASIPSLRIFPFILTSTV